MKKKRRCVILFIYDFIFYFLFLKKIKSIRIPFKIIFYLYGGAIFNHADWRLTLQPKRFIYFQFRVWTPIVL